MAVGRYTRGNTTRREKMKHYVYTIMAPHHTDIFTQGYVGETTRIKQRFAEYKNSMALGKCFNPILQRAANKYGIDKLLFSIFASFDCNDAEHLAKMLEKVLRPTRDIGYNILAGGNSANQCGVNHLSSTEAWRKAHRAGIDKRDAVDTTWRTNVGAATKRNFQNPEFVARHKAGLAVADKTNIVISNKERKGKPIEINGIVYISLREAGEELGIFRHTLRKLALGCQSRKHLEYKNKHFQYIKSCRFVAK